MIRIPDFIYPKDRDGHNLCPRCKKLVPQCDCPSLEPKKVKSSAIKPIVSLDKSGRKGKMVTCISSLPTHEAYLKDLAKKLKIKTGSGGTFYVSDNAGIIELQGDHRELVSEYLKNRTTI